MKYRKFGKLDWQASALGFGAMRLPVLNGNPSQVDEAQVIKMIRYAVDHGVNYIDSAYGYHRGNSEIVIGKALQDGYREKMRIATKLPCHDANSPEDFDRILNDQLKKLKTDKIDFYLLHHLNRLVWPKMRDMGILKWADNAIADGRIGYFGFSYHDNFETLKEIINAYDNWTVCQIQYNYMDEDVQAGTRGLEYAYKKDLAVVVMEPIKGGRIAVPPEKVAKIWTQATVQRTPQEWALRWVWNHPEVSVVLSGMSKFEQVVENVAFAEYSQPHNLTKDELTLIGQVRDTYRSLGPVSCTACGYCTPCPNGVEIPRILEFYNEAILFNDSDRRRRMYTDHHMLKDEQLADKCIKCEICLEKCPQKLPIPDLLEKAHAYLTMK
jgi:predicted aldo/keto reductase-like oxidoreductase